jgi:exodeoxyribonuclease V alpha subunit
VPVMPAYAGPADGVSFVPASGREAIADATARLYADLGGRDGDILIVTPVNAGPCGTSGLNRRLHDAYVEASGLQELRGALGEIFSAGEPVLHRRNDYKRGLFNGSMGKVLRIDRTARSLVALFDGEEHTFESADLVDLSLGYALTCRRSQGSESSRWRPAAYWTPHGCTRPLHARSVRLSWSAKPVRSTKRYDGHGPPTAVMSD